MLIFIMFIMNIMLICITNNFSDINDIPHCDLITKVINDYFVTLWVWGGWLKEIDWEENNKIKRVKIQFLLKDQFILNAESVINKCLKI